MSKIEIKTSAWALLWEIDAAVWKTLLSQIEAAGIEIPNACKTGICWACLCTVPEGGEYIDKSFRGEPAFPLGDDELMTCIASVKQTNAKIELRTMTD